MARASWWCMERATADGSRARGACRLHGAMLQDTDVSSVVITQSASQDEWSVLP